MKRGVADCLSRFEGEACVSEMVVKGFRLLPPNQHLGENGPWNVSQMGNIVSNVRRLFGFWRLKKTVERT